jgi:glutathione synthase
MDTYLCTFKVFQYQLQKPEILLKYVPEELIANDLRRFFAKIYYVNEMSEEERIKIFKEIREDVHKYIVKPQKEGGGNNYYNEEILKLLPEEGSSEITEHLRNSMIMERINPPEIKTSLLHHNILRTLKTISEISVYGIILSNTDKIWMNETAGFLIRTKEHTSQEGGVIVGVSAIDLPHLVNVPLEKNSPEPLKFD